MSPLRDCSEEADGEEQDFPGTYKDNGQDDEVFFKKVCAYQLLASREHMEMTFHICARHVLSPPTDCRNVEYNASISPKDSVDVTLDSYDM